MTCYSLCVLQSMPNHRANDVVVIENAKQSLEAKFMYGALDMAALSKERVIFFSMYCKLISQTFH